MKLDVTALQALAQQQDVAVDEVVGTVEAALALAYAKMPGAVANASVQLDGVNGDLWVLDEEGRDVTPSDFGRTAATAARQAMVMWLRDLERIRKVGSWAGREGSLVSGTVRAHQWRNAKGETVVDLGSGAEGVLPAGESTPGEEYTHGQRLTALILAVNVDERDRVKITLSRRQPTLVSALFALNVPEIQSGQVDILGVAREAGVRSKIGVRSTTGWSALSVMVGPAGERARKVASVLGSERIDVVEDPGSLEGYVAAALTPAKVTRVEVVDEARGQVRAYVESDQVVLAQGQQGRNARLAGRLTGTSIEVVAE